MSSTATTPARPARQQTHPARAGHIAAIHALKSKCGLSDEDYRALLHSLTGQRSSKDLGAGQQLQVRQHLQKLADKLSPAPSSSTRRPWVPQADFDKQRKAAPPKERKLWALWGQLARAGKIHAPTAASLQAWVQRQTGASHLRFVTDAQLVALIESAKLWLDRPGTSDPSDTTPRT